MTNFENGFRPGMDIRQTWVRLYGSDGKLIRTNEVSLPGAEQVSLFDASVSRSGLEAIAVQGVNADGKFAGAIVLFDRPGPPKLVIRTNPFIPDEVAVAPDGFIWIAGTVPEIEYGPATNAQKRDLCVLQKYGPEGALVGSFLRRSTFDKKVRPWSNNRGGNASIRASASGVGIYVPHDDGFGEWIELSLAGDFKGRWSMAAPSADFRAGTMGFTDSGSVYANWGSTSEPGPLVGNYRLNKVTSAWDRVADPPWRSPDGQPMGSNFVGTDGNLLVFATGSKSATQVFWFQEPPK
jgi:hypothetical protein